MNPDTHHGDPSHQAARLKEETGIKTPPQHKTGAPTWKAAEDLKGIREELKRRNFRETSKWTITECIEELEMIERLRTATGDERRELEERFKENFEEKCFGHQLAAMMHFVCEHGDQSALYDKACVFMTGARPTISPSSSPHTREANTLYEKFVEGLFIKGGCEIQKRDTRKDEKNPDIWCSRGDHEFVVECKRVKSIKQIEKRISEAKDQLCPFRRNSRRTLVIALDCTLPVIKASTALVKKPQRYGDYLVEQIWRQIRTIYVRKVRRHKNVGWDFLATAEISCFTPEYHPTFYIQLLPRGVTRYSEFRKFIEGLGEGIKSM